VSINTSSNISEYERSSSSKFSVLLVLAAPTYRPTAAVDI